MKQVELLAPAKNIKSIKAGIQYADAFYMGYQDFNMRMQSDNFDEQSLKRAVEMLHDQEKKAYLTTNILIYENELSDLKKLIEFAHSIEIDALIVHDLAAIQFAKDEGIPFHISTQANVSNSVSARFFEHLGAERIVLARECSLEQIKEIKSKLTKCGIEVFIHGAMCASISGRCYFSQDVCKSEQYSANRGRCVQPCRRQWRVIDEENNEYIYDGQRFMNSRDLCMIWHIPELIDANVDSFKIEGRMRSPHYVEVVTKAYREAIQATYEGKFSRNLAKKLAEGLKKEYNRGFTTGFYFKRATQEDQQHQSPTNLSHWRPIKMGHFEDYDQKTGYGTAYIDNGMLKKGMDIMIEGSKDSDTYFHQIIEEMIYKNKKVEETPKGLEKSPFRVQIKLDKPVNGNNIDEIFVFTEETYENREKKTKGRKKSHLYRL